MPPRGGGLLQRSTTPLRTSSRRPWKALAALSAVALLGFALLAGDVSVIGGSRTAHARKGEATPAGQASQNDDGSATRRVAIETEGAPVMLTLPPPEAAAVPPAVAAASPPLQPTSLPPPLLPPAPAPPSPPHPPPPLPPDGIVVARAANASAGAANASAVEPQSANAGLAPAAPPSPPPPPPPTPPGAPGAPGAPADVATPGGSLPRPRIYVYDLPERLRTPCHWPLTCRLHDHVARSPHRTTNPAEADYFWIPHKMPVENDEELREILRIVTHEHPWFNASHAAGRARHVMVFSCDHGPAPCTWAEPVCADASGLASWPAAVNPASPNRSLLFLGPSGVRDGADAGGPCCAGCFQRGKDVVLPPMTPGRDWDPDVAVAGRVSPWLGSGEEAEDFVREGMPRHGAPVRDTLLWFAGAVGADAAEKDTTGRVAPFVAFPDPRRNASGAKAVLPHLPPSLSRLRVALLDTAKEATGDKSVTFEAWAPRALFCLDPMGTHGGWAARFTPALFHGCVPLNTRPTNVALAFDDHPAVRWDAFAVAVPAPMGATYAATLRAAVVEAARPARISALRAAARATYTRLLWTSVHGRSLAGEPADGSTPDAWATLMDILQARLERDNDAGKAAAAGLIMR